MAFIQAGDLRVWFERPGLASGPASGSKLLYITGTGADLRKVPNPLGSPLATAFDLLTFDQRGLGQTDKPNGPYTMAQYAEDANNLLAAVGWESCSVIGVSFGGMVAQELAIRFPHKVAKLVLCCCSTGGAGGASYPLHELEHLGIEDKIHARLTRTDTRVNAEWIAAHPDDYKAMVDKALADALADASRFGGEPGRAEGARWQLMARAAHDTWDRAPTITAPTLVCGGKYDGQAEPAVVAALAKRIPGAELAMFEGGHGFLNQDPAAALRIAAFLAG
ncbi:MAG: alpha/beta hydrolase fold [Rhodospirillales bacterium]|nr:alpha/beta hydrolase fold [Rhodospirillales bacterium]